MNFDLTDDAILGLPVPHLADLRPGALLVFSPIDINTVHNCICILLEKHRKMNGEGWDIWSMSLFDLEDNKLAQGRVGWDYEFRLCNDRPPDGGWTMEERAIGIDRCEYRLLSGARAVGVCK